MTESVGVAIITHCAKHHLPFCLPPLLQSSLKPRIVVVNSSSHDGTVEVAEQMGVETLVIPRSDFNHGTTRERARIYLGTDIVVMMTPDAYAQSEEMLRYLIKPLAAREASASYARQIPHHGASFFEAFARDFNYPAQGHIRSKQEASQFGIYSIFFSNSCGAYRNQALDEINGFTHLLLGEDTFAVAALLNKGHRIAYVADAVIKHSHHYTLLQEFKRHFDVGLVRRQFHPLIAEYGTDNQRGKQYVKEILKKVCSERPTLLPYALAHIGAKWLGYQCGKRSCKAPKWWKRLLSSQEFFWS